MRLYYSLEISQELEYLTLSHMWGKQEFLTLTWQNHDEFLREVPLEKISRTFQDAIFITAELGFRYLWIDSLAIVQNVPED